MDNSSGAPPTDRLRELAIIGAKQGHGRVTGAQADTIIVDGHQGPFSTCQHPDCVLVRETGAAQPATAPKWLVDALNGLIGLIQLLPDEKRRDLITNHRYLDALTASNRIESGDSGAAPHAATGIPAPSGTTFNELPDPPATPHAEKEPT